MAVWPSGQNAHHCLGQNSLYRTVFSVGSGHKLEIIVAMGTKNPICMNDMELWLIFLQTLIESLVSIHDIIPGIYGQYFEIRRLSIMA